MTNIVFNFAATEEAPSGVAALGIDPKAFIIQLITWLFVFLVLRKFVFKPVVKILQNRQDAIDEGMRLTTEMVAEKDKLEKEVAAAHTSARKEANEILAKTHEQATAMIKEAEEAAQAKVDKMIARVRSNIEKAGIIGRYAAWAERPGCTVYEVNNFQTLTHFDWVPPVLEIGTPDCCSWR